MNTENKQNRNRNGGDNKLCITCDELYLKYSEYVNNDKYKLNTKYKKLYYIKHFLTYTSQRNVKSTSEIKSSIVYDYINSLNFTQPTIKDIKTKLRQLFDWTYTNEITIISGKDLFPLIRKNERTKILSYYTKEELEKLLSCVDNTTLIGKRDYLILCLLIYYGIRIGDIINLKFDNIDWNNKFININQLKTNGNITYPLVDEVKFALIDYIKNARNECENKEHILITTCPPYKKYNSQGFHKEITRYMDKAKINYENKKHGSHSFRHSLATNLMRENVPLSAISSVLGHSSTKTTEIYLTVDESNLKELSLEVPYV